MPNLKSQSTVPYVFSEEKQQNLLSKSFELYDNNDINSLSDIFKIDIDLDLIEEFYIRTCILSYYKYGRVDTVDTVDTIVHSTSLGGGLVELNHQFSEKIIENVVSVSFNSLYPSTLLNIEEEFSNIVGLNRIYEDVFLEYTRCKRDGESDSKIYIKYINSMYGILGSRDPKSYIKCNFDISRISRKSSYLMSKLKREFEGHYIYIDTDTIYFYKFNEIEERLIGKLQEISSENKYLSYDITEYNKAIFMKKKKYLLFPEEIDLISKGLRIV